MNPYVYRQLSTLSAAINIGNGLSSISTAVVAAAGSGYRTGDLLALSGGTSLFAASVRVASVSPLGAVQRLVVEEAGAYTVKPPNAVTATGGTGTGCTLTLGWLDDVPPLSAIAAIVQPETQSVRWRDDGGTPTASVGMLLVANDTIILTGRQMRAAKVIEATASAKLNITFYRG